MLDYVCGIKKDFIIITVNMINESKILMPNVI